MIKVFFGWRRNKNYDEKDLFNVSFESVDF